MKLIIGNKNYSSWSLRAWLLLRVKNIPFEEERIVLGQPDTNTLIRRYSPSGKVPVLIDGNNTVWDTLAIAEYLAERFPQHAFWPTHMPQRTRARSITAEMHSGFSALRSKMSMNCRASLPGKGATPEAMADVARIVNIWESCRSDFGSGGDFLFGEFCIADAFYAPVASRFLTYNVPLTDTAKRYVDAIHGLPAMREWTAAAQAELEHIPAFEPYR